MKKQPLPLNPIQPLVIDEHGTLRYKQNVAVQRMYDALVAAGIDPFTIVRTEGLSQDDFGQFVQLLGHSHVGANGQWGITEEVYQTARRMYEKGDTELVSRNKYLEHRHQKMAKKLAPLCAHVFDIDIDDLEAR